MADVAQRIWPGLVGVLDQPFLRIGLTIFAASAAIAWIASAFWCFRDTRARTRDVLAPYLTSGMVLLFSPALFPFGLAIYVLVRPHETSHERELRKLARAALDSSVAESSCRACGERIDRRWIRCPACATRLAATCVRCDRSLDPDWSICPWCAAPQVVAGMPAPAAMAMGTPSIVGSSSAAGNATAASPAPRVATIGLTGAAAAAAPSMSERVPVVATATPALGPTEHITSHHGLGASVAPSPAADGPRDNHPVPMGPARRRSDRGVRPATERVPPQRVPAPRPAASMKRLRAVREGVRTAQSLGDRRPVTGARVLQSTSTATTASAIEAEAESLGRNHAVPRRT